jgi:poly-gamma-glutamate synthase PgsB/CapB
MNKIIDSKKIFSSPADVENLLTQGQHPFWRQLNARLLARLLASFGRWPAPLVSDAGGSRTVAGLQAQHAVEFLLYEITATLEQMEQLRNRYNTYCSRYLKAIGKEEKQTRILEFAQELGASRRDLRRDGKAFARWFGHDAVTDRYKRRHLDAERYLSFSLQCLGRAAAAALLADGETAGHQKLWRRLKLEAVVQPLLNYGGDSRVVSSAFQALAQSVRTIPPALQHGVLAENSLRFVYHAALKTTQSVWVQCEALGLLQSSAPEQLYTVLSIRFEHPQGDDDLFVRRKAVEILGERIPCDAQLAELLPVACRDPSPSVRQKIPEVLHKLDTDLIERHWRPLLLDDPCEQVRASALLGLLPLLARTDGFVIAVDYLKASLSGEQQKFPLRTALHVCRQGLDALLPEEKRAQKQRYLQALLPAIEHLHGSAQSLSVRRWAAQTREYLLCIGDAGMHRAIDALRSFVAAVPPGKTRRLPGRLILKDDAQFGRALSLIAQQDFGLDVEKNPFGCFLTRGHSFGFRLWRLLHEFRHPSPDKRQAFSHTVGRLFWGRMRIPSAILSELAETKVPGEPLFIDTEDGWREYLPLLDEVLSALHAGARNTTIYHGEGTTVIRPPAFWPKRWWASWTITFRFAHYARLRNWREQSGQAPQAYLDALARLGIRVAYQGHRREDGETSEDPAVLRFFPAFLPFSGSAFWEQFKDYFVSVYENSLYELAVFICAAMSYFIGRHIYLYRKIRTARSRLALVIGGWGTRGKSGTERIKAALMNALGYGVISKTTGCEAMILHAHPFGELREMFLFRPYDKATIWEQHNLVCLADRLKTEVFLWECMGLTPSYIDILQRQWMRDDLSTITNAYPDHEDLQGPAGINIPQVMAEFIPSNSVILTSEEQMRPILEDAARKRDSRFRAVTWLEAELLAPDVLARFPYEEHPYNVALVLALADELGIGQDFALKEMADRVVADIGVLKTFPCAPWRSRRLEFINGMSANERYGSLSNWRRVGLDRPTIEEQPDTWIVAVVNNRADRIARSRVFASILVKDVSVDRCVLIGNNLTGLLGYIKESWVEWVATVDLFVKGDTPASSLLKTAKWFRIPYSEELLARRFKCMLEGQGAGLDVAPLLSLIASPEQLAAELDKLELPNRSDILHFLNAERNLLTSYQTFAWELTDKSGLSAETQAGLQRRFRELLWQWFEQKLVVVEDYYATGNQVIETVGNATPPGFYARIMGMQNIKGTGLDFVYCWQAWETCCKACRQLASPSPAESAKGLAALANFQEYGVLAEETVRDVVATVKQAAIAQNERYQAELAIIAANVEKALQNINAQRNSQTSGNTFLQRLVAGLEAFLDAGDAVKRRKQANRIYRDLVAERISHERAALELQKLNKRQKGGWLSLDSSNPNRLRLLAQLQTK